MTNINSTGLAANALSDLGRFINITKANNQALIVWNEYIEQERPVFDISTDSSGQPVFNLSGSLASFL